MKSKKKPLVAAAMSALLALAGSVSAQDTGGDKANKGIKTTSGKKATKVRRHRRGRKGHKGGKKGKKSSGGTTTPPPK